MKVNCKDYETSKQFILRIYDKDGYKAMSFVSAITGVPLVVILTWIGDTYGYSEELNKHIESLVQFYGYTEINK